MPCLVQPSSRPLSPATDSELTNPVNAVVVRFVGPHTQYDQLYAETA